MKNLFYLAVVAVLFVQSVIACKGVNEIYSCDEETNEWVKNNFKEIQQMNRQELVKLSQVKQRASFATFKPSKKYNIWVDKLNNVKKSNFNQDELKHIDLLLEKMEVAWFDENPEKDSVRSYEKELFLKKWMDDAHYLLAWNKEDIRKIVETLEDVEKKNDMVVSMAPLSSPEISDDFSSKENCNCSASSDFCPEVGPCSKGGCKERSGCGLVWSYTCDGRCRLGL